MWITRCDRSLVWLNRLHTWYFCYISVTLVWWAIQLAFCPIVMLNREQIGASSASTVRTMQRLEIRSYQPFFSIHLYILWDIMAGWKLGHTNTSHFPPGTYCDTFLNTQWRTAGWKLGHTSHFSPSTGTYCETSWSRTASVPLIAT